jgi:hypothetical protein
MREKIRNAYLLFYEREEPFIEEIAPEIEIKSEEESKQTEETADSMQIEKQ